MSTLIGDIAPNFDVKITNGPIKVHTQPGDSQEFFKRNIKPIGFSTDTAEEHKTWILVANDTQNTTLTFPIVADPDLKIAKLYRIVLVAN